MFRGVCTTENDIILMNQCAVCNIEQLLGGLQLSCFTLGQENILQTQGNTPRQVSFWKIVFIYYMDL